MVEAWTVMVPSSLFVSVISANFGGAVFGNIGRSAASTRLAAAISATRATRSMRDLLKRARSPLNLDDTQPVYPQPSPLAEHFPCPALCLVSRRNGEEKETPVLS